MRTAFLTLASVLTLCLLSVTAEAAQRALLVGISDYQHLPYYSERLKEQFKDLSGPRNDVQLLHQALIARYHFPPEAIRGLTVLGITTDASPLHPVPITEVFGPVPHQICEFPIVAEITKAVLQVVTQVRKTLAAQMPKLPRGRPASAELFQRRRPVADPLDEGVGEDLLPDWSSLSLDRLREPPNKPLIRCGVL